jgi:hypothetical protein
LRLGYPEPLLQLTRQFVAEGMDHFNRFREINVVLRSWPSVPSGIGIRWLRPVQVGSPETAGKHTRGYALVQHAAGAGTAAHECELDHVWTYNIDLWPL